MYKEGSGFWTPNVGVFCTPSKGTQRVPSVLSPGACVIRWTQAQPPGALRPVGVSGRRAKVGGQGFLCSLLGAPGLGGGPPLFILRTLPPVSSPSLMCSGHTGPLHVSPAADGPSQASAPLSSPEAGSIHVHVMPLPGPQPTSLPSVGRAGGVWRFQPQHWLGSGGGRQGWNAYRICFKELALY